MLTVGTFALTTQRLQVTWWFERSWDSYPSPSHPQPSEGSAVELSPWREQLGWEHGTSPCSRPPHEQTLLQARVRPLAGGGGASLCLHPFLGPFRIWLETQKWVEDPPLFSQRCSRDEKRE